MHSNKHCCLCGALRRITQAPVRSFGNGGEIISMADHRPMQDGRWEAKPQLIVNVSVWRNGGTDALTHMCDECIVVGLRAAKTFVDDALAALGHVERQGGGDAG